MTAAVVEAAAGAARVVLGLAPLDPASSVLGPAVTAACAPEDNLALHRALASATPGSVLVVSASLAAGHFGDLMARDALRRGVAALLIDGAVRDAATIVALGLPVFCAGTNPVKAAKNAARSAGEPIDFRGVRVEPGDMVVADRDAVAFVPAADWPRVEAAVAELERAEAAIVARLEAGETLAEIAGVPLG